jgi:hypothetical protein
LQVFDSIFIYGSFALILATDEALILSMWIVLGANTSFLTGYLGTVLNDIGSCVRNCRLVFSKSTLRKDEWLLRKEFVPVQTTYDDIYHIADECVSQLMKLHCDEDHTWKAILEHHFGLLKGTPNAADRDMFISNKLSLLHMVKEEDSTEKKHTPPASIQHYSRHGLGLLRNMYPCVLKRKFHSSTSLKSPLSSLVREADKYPNDLKSQTSLLKVTLNKNEP